DALVDRAERLAESDPGQANRLWRRVFRSVTDRAIIVPTHNYTQSMVVSERIGNFQAGTVLGPLLDQMWVR
ncbi:MAG TPA: hypothetical protein VK640_01370, partial [Actinomycetes bacterium]|nr:hypothetical protein [Actinomycetes bacterium]